MLSWILGTLGVGTVGILGLGIALKLGLLAFLPGAVVNAIAMLFEGLFRLASWALETFFTGNTNIFKTWQAGFALACWILMAMLIGPDPLKVMLSWRPWHQELPAADMPSNMPRNKPPKSFFDGVKKSLGINDGSTPKRRDDDVRSIFRHPLG